MGDRTGNVVVIQALIEPDRCSKALHKCVGGLAEASTPWLFGGCGLIRLFLVRHGVGTLVTCNESNRCIHQRVINRAYLDRMGKHNDEQWLSRCRHSAWPPAHDQNLQQTPG